MLQLVAVVACAEFLTRLVFPLGTEQLRLQLALFPQYILLFAFGVAAWRRGWLGEISARVYRRCRAAALIAAGLLPPIAAAGGGLDDGSPVLGGPHWESAAFAIADAALACCASFWLLGLFRRHRGGRGSSELGRSLSRRAYGAYIVQPIVIVPFALALSPVPAPGELKFLAMAPLAVAASFALGARPRRRPAHPSPSPPVATSNTTAPTRGGSGDRLSEEPRTTPTRSRALQSRTAASPAPKGAVSVCSYR